MKNGTDRSFFTLRSLSARTIIFILKADLQSTHDLKPNARVIQLTFF